MTLTKRSLKMLGKNANYFSDPHFQDIIERRQTKRSQQSFICYLIQQKKSFFWDKKVRDSQGIQV